MIAGSDEADGLARGVVGSARTTLFGTSTVVPSTSGETMLGLVVAWARHAANVVLPKNSVGTKQLKKNAVTTPKIRNGAVTGAKIKLSPLGKVPFVATL